jgi:pentatricopeptide repeat protein
MRPEEKKFIQDNQHKLSPQEIARRLGVKERKVVKYLDMKKQKAGVKAAKQEEGAPVAKTGLLKILIAVLVISAVTFASYSNTFKSPMLWDDINLVKNNPDIKSFKTAGKALRENLGYGVVQQKSSSYRPFQSITYIFDYEIWGNNVFGFHLTNVTFHALAALAAFWLILVLFNDYFLALFTAMIYAVHPIHTEAVAYISGRADPMSSAFILAALVCYILYHKKPNVLYLVFGALLFVGGLGSRENSIILPLLALLYNYVFKKKIQWPAIATFVGIGLLYIIGRVTETIGAIGESQTLGTTIMQRLPGTFVAMTNYMRLMFMPVNLHMEYGRPVFPWSDPKAIAGVFIVAAVIALAVYMRKRNTLVCFGLLWYLVNIIPVSNIVPVNAYMAEHWLYVPCIGIILIVCHYLRNAFDRPAWRNAVLIAVIAVTSVFGYMTYQQNKTWQNPIAFYQGLIKYAPRSARLYSDLSTAYFAEGRYDSAIAVLKTAIQLKPDYAFAHNNIGAIYNAKKEYDKAIPHLKKAIELNEGYDVAHFNLGNAYKDSGQLELAAENYEKCIEINPRYFDAYDALGIIYSNTNDLAKAEAFYKKAIDLFPEGPRAYNNLASAYLRANRLDEALQYYEMALERQPDHPGILHNMGNIYARMKQTEKAIYYLEKAVSANTTYKETYTRLAAIYQSIGKTKEAQELIAKAKQLK